MKDSSGIVYVFTNPAMNGIVKIGLTKKSEIDTRLKELFTTSVPVPFECAYACMVDDCKSVEKALHIAFNPNRIHPKREFFRIDPEQAIVILQLHGKPDISKEINKKIDATTLPEDKKAGKELKKARRPPLNFFEMGMKTGEKLEFNSGGKNVIVEISGDKKVKYNKKEYSLTALTQELFDLDYAIQPTKYWYYNGQNLVDLYNQTYTEQ